ncbi:TldD/PmbA family protein [Oscillatoria sp. CS-180]|uniref:TldD/PmbA family protein n=1 Tax=Oscillatoria sp. CS-180 TaxID=3021720 RepID=UPI00232E41E9|nr:TldD/PmbA family protein [Oscillatoria sp. CS-180]MDB9528135.1 TldD/PmbA family protein [Oscillatoria sp. CS-180]
MTATPLRTTADPIDLLKDAIASLDLAADWIGIRALREESVYRSQRDGNPESNRRSVDQGAMVEVLVQGQIGYAATNRLTVEGLRQAAEQAFQQAQAALPWQIYAFDTSVRPDGMGAYHSFVEKPLRTLSTAEAHDLLSRICQGLKVSDKIVQASASISAKEVDTWLVSSSGTQIHQHFSLFTPSYGATAQDGAIVQTRTNNGRGHSYQGGWEFFEQGDLVWEAVQRTGEQAVELLTADECPEMTTTLVLAPDQMMLQIHESIGHPLELDRILGDERNYAGGSFVQPADFGNLRYGSKLLNVTFDPTVEQEFASYAFDDTGVVAEKQYLIHEGVLQRGLGSRESQMRLGVPGVACARATSWDRPPIDRMANINVEPGDRSFAQIIGAIEDGVYMEANRSWSIDDQRYKFQFGCEYAKRIRNGQLAETLRNPNYRATTPQFWGSLAQVGDRSTWQMFGTPFCGKGEPNQVIRVGHGAPVCAFNTIEVFGGVS